MRMCFTHLTLPPTRPHLKQPLASHHPITTSLTVLPASDVAARECRAGGLPPSLSPSPPPLLPSLLLISPRARRRHSQPPHTAHTHTTHNHYREGGPVTGHTGRELVHSQQGNPKHRQQHDEATSDGPPICAKQVRFWEDKWERGRKGGRTRQCRRRGGSGRIVCGWVDEEGEEEARARHREGGSLSCPVSSHACSVVRVGASRLGPGREAHSAFHKHRSPGCLGLCGSHAWC